MTRRDQYAKGQHPYGANYRRARALLLANNPPCHWCGAPATTADHEPPLSKSPRPHLNLVPACRACNYSRSHPGQTVTPAYPGPSRVW